ncbi:MAG: type I-MYXAN CRISPR-associated protein Cas6/Cmx6 [Spirulinaceae cyanobacterium SM2_1_0]|nr:type I-MYXAN CRISPR-associated protein Cas6/Cmx6 [Spirulinaceae cyanobacterium SM2_1_0]
MTNYLEVQFSLRGKTLPADHGYALYACIKRLIKSEDYPEVLRNRLLLEGGIAPEVLFCSVPGIPDRNGTIFLNRESRFRLRCPAEQAKYWYQGLQNQVLDLNNHMIRLIQPRLTLPHPSAVLKARLVVFKLERWNTHEAPSYFQDSCRKALARLGIDAQIIIDDAADGSLALRALKIKDKQVLGFGVKVEGLQSDDSIKLQCLGLGGRKHFGCGWFYPADKEASHAA